MAFEVMWYEEEELIHNNYKEFKTRKQALAFYEKHKNDVDKFGWWVTRRDNETWEILEDIII